MKRQCGIFRGASSTRRSIEGVSGRTLDCGVKDREGAAAAEQAPFQQAPQGHGPGTRAKVHQPTRYAWSTWTAC
jgi:hypothetical protein